MRFLFLLPMVLALSPALTLAPLAWGDETKVCLVDGTGQPVQWHWGSLTYCGMGQTPPSFTTGLVPGPSSLLGMFLVDHTNGKITTLTPGMKMEGSVLTLDADPVAQSLHQSMGVVCAAGRVYVAEACGPLDPQGSVCELGADGKVVRRIPVVEKPLALAIAGQTLYVAGDKELGAFDLGDGHPLFRTPLSCGAGVCQLAVLGDRLYLGERATPAVRVFDAQGGTEQGILLGPELVVKPDLSGVGVAVNRAGNLLVGDSTSVREFALPSGRATLVRKIADVNGGRGIAVDGEGNVAVAVPNAQDRDFQGEAEVWVFNAQGEPRQRLVHVYMRGPAEYDNKQPDSLYQLRVFGGLIGSLRSPGGVAFDDRGNLYISDSLRYPRSPTDFWPDSDQLQFDGGVIRVTPEGQFEARLGSRFSDGTLIASRLAQRRQRPPFLRTAAAIGQGKLSLLAWGDSITQCGSPDWNGGATKPENNWVHLLARRLEARHPGLKVEETANGVGGQNAAESLSRDPAAAATEGAQPNLILIELGTNDQVFRLETPDQFAASLRAMLTQLIVRTDSDLVLVTPGALPATRMQEPPEVYVRTMQEVGKELNVPVLNMNAGITQILAAENKTYLDLHNGPENPHPNDAGHQAWAQVATDFIQNQLNPSASGVVVQVATP